MKTFEIGEIYKESIPTAGDGEYPRIVIARTAQFITSVSVNYEGVQRGEPRRNKIDTCSGHEAIYHGPCIMSADY